MNSIWQRIILFATFSVFILCSGYAFSASAKHLYQLAMQQYDTEDYETAAELLKMAMKAEPDVSEYHHLLGKSYGRIAEESHPLKAMEYSRKTLRALKKAVELNDENIPAMNDLIKFYQQAPGFLGGDLDKANALLEKIERLRAQSNFKD